MVDTGGRGSGSSLINMGKDNHFGRSGLTALSVVAGASWLPLYLIGSCYSWNPVTTTGLFMLLVTLPALSLLQGVWDFIRGDKRAVVRMRVRIAVVLAAWLTVVVIRRIESRPMSRVATALHDYHQVHGRYPRDLFAVRSRKLPIIPEGRTLIPGCRVEYEYLSEQHAALRISPTGTYGLCHSVVLGDDPFMYFGVPVMDKMPHWNVGHRLR